MGRMGVGVLLVACSGSTGNYNSARLQIASWFDKGLRCRGEGAHTESQVRHHRVSGIGRTLFSRARGSVDTIIEGDRGRNLRHDIERLSTFRRKSTG